MSIGSTMLADGFTALLGVHGVSASYTPVGGSASTITVNKSEPHEVIDQFGEVSSSRPYLRCKTSDVPSVGKSDIFVIAGVTWSVTEVEEPNLSSGVTKVFISTESPT